MNNTNFFSIVLSEKFHSLQSEAIVVYLILRADVELGITSDAVKYKEVDLMISGLSVNGIAERTGISFLTVNRMLDLLLSKEWIKRHEVNNLIRLGDKSGWYADVECTTQKTRSSHKAQFNRLMDEMRERKESESKIKNLSKDTKDKMLAPVRKMLKTGKGVSREILDHFNKKFYAMFGKLPVQDAGSFKSENHKSYTYINRMLVHCNEDMDRLKGVISFALENWIALKKVMSISGLPSINVICTKGFFNQFEMYLRKGIPEEKTERSSDMENAKEIGW